MSARDYLGIICMILPFILMVFLIKFMYREHRKYNPVIKGEIIKVKASVEESLVKVSVQGEVKLHLIVKYVIVNREYTNDIFLRANVNGVENLNKGKTIDVIVDKKDYYNIAVEPEWLYNSGAMLEDNYIKRKNKL